MNHLQILHFCLSLIENETDKELEKSVSLAIDKLAKEKNLID